MPSGDLFARRQRDRRAARRTGHHRGPQLAGARLLRPPGRGRPLPRRDDPRPAGARALRPDAHRARGLPRAVPHRPAGLRRAHADDEGEPSRCPASRSPCAPATRCSARSGPPSTSPLSDERTEALRDAAKLVALHLLRVRAGADVERRLRADLLSTALEGGTGAREALDRLGLADQPLVVLALAVGPATERQRLAMRSRCTSVPSTHGRRRRWSATSPTGWSVRATRTVRNALSAGRPGLPGPGRRSVTAPSSASVPLCGTSRLARRAPVQTAPCEYCGRQSAYTARGPAGRRPGRGAAARTARPGRSPRRASRPDRSHDWSRTTETTTPHLVETLRAWLDAFGDVTAAAAAAYVHPNTFRYRLRRLAEVGKLDLTDPEARFAAMLQLRLFATDLASNTVSGSSLVEPC